MKFKINSEDKYKFKYYVLFVFMIILSVFTIKTNIKLNDSLEEESYLVFNSDDNVIYQDSNCNNRDTRFIDNNYIINNKKMIDPKKVNNNNFRNKVNNKVNNKQIIKKLEFVKPLDGKIIKDYSESLVYSKTLDMWKIHDGIDIKAKLNDIVIAAEDGIVERIFNDSFYGNTIIMSHSDNYLTIYCNVSSNLKINDKVNKYDIIGRVDNSSVGEFKDDYHLHFMMKCNNVIINPNTKIKFN